MGRHGEWVRGEEEKESEMDVRRKRQKRVEEIDGSMVGARRSVFLQPSCL